MEKNKILIIGAELVVARQMRSSLEQMGYIVTSIVPSGKFTIEEVKNNNPDIVLNSIESIYVFTDKNGNPYKEIKSSFSTALKKAEIRDFRFHDLRHTFASHLVMAGVDLTSVKELLGHKTLNMTLRYSHLSQGHKRKAVNTLDNVLNNTQSKILHYKNTTISGSDLHTAYRKSFDNKDERGVLNPRP